MRLNARLKINLKLYKNHKRYLSTTRRVKAKVITVVQEQSNKYDYGICRVWYDVENDYWNEFEFNNLKQLKDNLATDTELDLVRDFSLT